MAAEANILRTYGDQSRKQDVLGLIEILTAEESSIFNMLDKTTAIDGIHQTLVDTLATAGSLATGEGEDYSASALTTPTRLTNIVQTVAKKYSVTRMQQAIDHIQGENELTRQRAKAMKEWHNAAEYDLVRSTLVTGASGTTVKMSGILEAISKSTNYTAQNSGTVWSASILKGLMKANWDNSNGDVATDLFMGSFIKNATDDFSNKTNIVSNGVNTKEIVTVVDIFETGLGKVKVHPHRYIQISGTDATGRVLAIRPEKLKVAFLEKPYVDKGLARLGPYDPEAIVGSFTLEVRNQDSNWFATGYDID
jgi:hypothetical protein